MIKALIFDVSGVLTFIKFSDVYKSFAKKVNLSEDIITNYFGKNLDEHLVGKLHFQDIYEDMRGDLQNMTEQEFKKRWVETISEITTINQELLKKIDVWRNNYKCGILTNNTEGRGIVDRAIGLHEHFDFVLESNSEFMKKPDPNFFDLSLKRAECQAEEAVYVDDQQRHVDAATSLGMHGILYTDMENLLNSLASLEVI